MSKKLKISLVILVGLSLIIFGLFRITSAYFGDRARIDQVKFSVSDRP